jgi:glutathione peroxidase
MRSGIYLNPMSVIIDHTVESITGESVDLSDYRGKALLIVNVASRCGFTNQYAGLQELYERYRERGLEILGFPCNQFAGQEPGSNEAIQNFCRESWGVTFPMFAKLKVKGSKISPLYQALTQETDNGIRGSVKWNFAKFLVDPEGQVVERFGTRTKPLAATITDKVEAILPR